MLRDSNLPARFWTEAMATFMYEDERGTTPYEHFLWHKPDVGHMRSEGYTTQGAVGEWGTSMGAVECLHPTD